VVIGGATREERKALVPAVEAQGLLLMVPVACPGYETSNSVIFLGPTADQLTRAAAPWVAEEAKASAVTVAGNGSAFSWVASERLLGQVKLPAFNNRPPVKQFYAEEMQIADL